MNSSPLGAKSEHSLPSYQYSIHNYRVAVCSPYTGSFGILRDAPDSWEAFGMHSLPTYFSEGLQQLQNELRRFEDPSEQYDVEDEARLIFMVESLVQARRLLVEGHVETEP